MLKLLEKPYFAIVLYLFIILSSVVYYFYLYEVGSNDFFHNMFYLLGSYFALSIVMIFFIEKPFKYFFIVISVTFLIISVLYFLFYLWMIALASAF